MKTDPDTCSIEHLDKEVAVCRAQEHLLRSFVRIAHSQTDENKLMTTLQKALEISIELTGADKGSIFLLDEKGVVKESILTRSEDSPDKRAKLVGAVLDGGLAGWVRKRWEAALIEDTEKDNRWKVLPDQPYIARSALAVPILHQDKMLGIMTLLHSAPRHFDSDSVELSRMTAAQVAIILDNANLYVTLEQSFQELGRAKKEIEIYSSALDREMQKGRKLQKDFLPGTLPVIPGWEMAAALYPAIQVSGDFYDAFELGGKKLILVIGDVCDKGVGAALFMALFRSLIRVYAGQSHSADTVSGRAPERISLGGVIQQTNDYIATLHDRSDMFATLFYGELDTASGELNYINAGHEPPIVVGRGGVRHLLSGTGPALGLFDGTEYRIDTIHLNPGETLIGYTDGVTEAGSIAGALYTRERLHGIVAAPSDSAAETLQHLESDLFRFMEQAPRLDDITLLVVRRKSKAEA